MFGYIVVNQEELKLKEYKRYRSFYCGLCHCLKKRYGRKGQAVLSYDMTFLDILLNAMYERPLVIREKKCLAHPTKMQCIRYNEITEYVADMSIILTYYKLMDDWIDDRDFKSKTFAGSFNKARMEIENKYPEQTKIIGECIEKIIEHENAEEYDIDIMAGLSGSMLEAVFSFKDDEWSSDIKAIGFYLGKFVYLLDAYDDLQDDIKKNRYNIWKPYMNRKDFDAYAENLMMLMMADCARVFERLPIVQDVDILRNIIYSGVWTKYNIKKEKQHAKEKAE